LAKKDRSERKGGRSFDTTIESVAVAMLATEKTRIRQPTDALRAVDSSLGRDPSPDLVPRPPSPLGEGKEESLVTPHPTSSLGHPLPSEREKKKAS
jgi:hypothetical protein